MRTWCPQEPHSGRRRGVGSALLGLCSTVGLFALEPSRATTLTVAKASLGKFQISRPQQQHLGQTSPDRRGGGRGGARSRPLSKSDLSPGQRRLPLLCDKETAQRGQILSQRLRISEQPDGRFQTGSPPAATGPPDRCWGLGLLLHSVDGWRVLSGRRLLAELLVSSAGLRVPAPASAARGFALCPRGLNTGRSLRPSLEPHAGSRVAAPLSTCAGVTPQTRARSQQRGALLS